MTANRVIETTKSRPTQVEEVPSQALSVYLDSMLHEATMKPSVIAEEVVVIEQNEIAKPVSKDLTPQPTLKGKSLSEIKAAARARAVESKAKENEVISSPLKELATSEVFSAKPELEVQTEVEPDHVTPSWKPGELPEWAEEQFDCLVFDVGGLSLGVPMILLGTLYPIEGETLTPLFDQADWFKGIMRTSDDKNIRIVDTSALVMPEKHDKDSITDYKFAIGIFGTDWAMGAHNIIGSKLIQSTQVKWRTKRTTRAWLAGTIKEEMCAILDPKAFVDILLEAKPVKLR